MPSARPSPTRYHSTIVNSGLCSGPCSSLAEDPGDLVDRPAAGGQQPLHAELGRGLQPEPPADAGRSAVPRSGSEPDATGTGRGAGRRPCRPRGSGVSTSRKPRSSKNSRRRRSKPPAAAGSPKRRWDGNRADVGHGRKRLVTLRGCRVWPVHHGAYFAEREGTPVGHGVCLLVRLYSFTRSMYSPVRVSILIRSPMLTNTGQGNSAPGFHLAGLGDVGGRVAPGPRLAVLDLQDHVVGRRDADRVAVEEHHAADHALLEVSPRVVDLVRRSARTARSSRCP